MNIENVNNPASSSTARTGIVCPSSSVPASPVIARSPLLPARTKAKRWASRSWSSKGHQEGGLEQILELPKRLSEANHQIKRVESVTSHSSLDAELGHHFQDTYSSCNNNSTLLANSVVNSVGLAESPDETCRPITAEISATNKTAFSAVPSSNVAGNKTDSAVVNRSEVYFDGGSSLCGNAPASNKSDGSEKFRMHYLKQRSHSDSGEFQVTAEPLLIPVDENSETSSPSYYSSNSLVVRKNSETDLVATSCTAGSPSFEQKRMTGSVASLPASVGETTKNDHSKSFRKSNSNILKSPKSPKFSDSKAFKSPKLTDKHASKSPGEKKKKSPSWYNVLNPTYKSRSDDFKKNFKSSPDLGRLIADYSCAMQKDILVHGRLYISQSFICFYANIFRWETSLAIRCKDIIKLTKERTAKVIPNAIQICTKDEKYFFTSFGARDKSFLMMEKVWKNSLNDQPMTSREVWQCIHYSYGEELGLTSSDEDFVALTAEEKINFQTRLQKEVKMATQQLTESNKRLTPTFGRKRNRPSIFRSTPSSRCHSPENDLVSSPVATGEDLQIHLSVPLASGHHNNDLDSSVTSADDLVSPCSPDDNLEFLILPPDDELVLRRSEDDAVDDMSSDVSSEEGEVDRCSSHQHFPINVIDEILDLSVDSTFTHCFTDSQIYRDFTASKKTFVCLCDQHEHLPSKMLDEVFNLSADKLFGLVFTNSRLSRKHLKLIKADDVVLGPWPSEPDENGIKVRNIAYTLSLNYSIGPKHSPSTERQILYPESQPGHFYLVDTECVNGGIPYGDNFYVINRYCISKVSSSKCRLRITSQIKYRKSVWGLVKSFIEKNATTGIMDSFNVMADLLRNESSLQAQLCTKPTNPPRKKVLRKRHVERTPPKSAPILDNQNHVTSSKHSTSSIHSTPIKHVTKKSLMTKVKDDWSVRLTVDILVRLVCAVILVLMVFNAVLFYKLWCLEATTANFLMLKSAQFNNLASNDIPKSNDEWTKLLNQQHWLHKTEMERWKEILSSSIHLMDQMVNTLSDLKSTIDNHLVPDPDDART